MNNYSVKVVELNTVANQDMLGVQLGRLCISNNISVITVANRMNVSKATVYKWFAGKADISKHLRASAAAYYSLLPRLPSPPQ